MALFGKKDKSETEKKEGFFSRFLKKDKEPKPEETPVQSWQQAETPSAPVAASPAPVAAESIPEPAAAASMPVAEPSAPAQAEPARVVAERVAEAPAPAAEPVVVAPPASKPAPVAEEPQKLGFLGKLKAGLKKTRDSLMKGALGNLFLATRKIDEDLLEEIEEMLIGSDIGVQTTTDIIETIRREVKRATLKNGEQLKEAIKSEMLRILREVPSLGIDLTAKPTVILVVGVNGVGKTTTIGKVANHFRKQGKSVVVCAADTFRAAAVEQLQVWAQRAGVEIVLKEGSKDPAAVVYEALDRVKKLNADVLLVDTAGRLHNNPNLMNELDKIRRITTRAYEGAPHNVLLILDAVTGQNGLQQAKQFVEKVGVTDLILTKMDGTAKGGIAVAITKELRLPIRFVGVGEQMDDLLPFEPEAFVNSMFDN